MQRGRGPVVTLDDPAILASVRLDPVGFLKTLEPQVAIDEFQRGGDDLLLALKAAIDRSDTRGQYLLTGSTRFLTTRTLSETLTGRIGLVELLPLSVGERLGVHEHFLDRAFAGEVLAGTPMPLHRADYAELIAQGGFPEMVLGPTTTRFRVAWCRSYLDTVTAAANVEQVAGRSAGELVVSDLSREVRASAGLVESYLGVLGTLYLVRLLPG